MTKKVLFDFNGTLFLDSSFHLEAWARIYREIHGEHSQIPDGGLLFGARNDDIIHAMDPTMTAEERDRCSEHKEALYRALCLEHPEKTHLTPGAVELLDQMKALHIPFNLASASIRANIDFYFDFFSLERWFDRKSCVYDDGTYAHKGAMHIEAARRLGTNLADCLVIEDSCSAIAHAKADGAGFIVGLGDKQAHAAQRSAGADVCISDFTEFQWKWLD